MEDPEGDASVLGRLDHWESIYAQELANLQAHGDRGEVWFGESILHATVRFALLQFSSEGERDPKQSRVLEVGTGNGTLAIELCKRGFKNVTGSDYSRQSIQLASAVAEHDNVAGVQWVHDDILDTRLAPGFDMVVDKGTLDAIGLRSDGDHARLLYRRSVASLLEHNGLLIITSCNSSKEELVCEFTGRTTEGAACSRHGSKQANDRADNVNDYSFGYLDHVRTYPSYSFGGASGTKVCTVAFRRQ